MDRFTVSLDEYIDYLIKKWKTVVVLVVVFVMVFVLSTKIFGKEIEILPSEEYFSLKDEETSIAGYIENAPLMKIDSTCVQEIVLYVSNISERDAVKDFINSGSVWDEFGDDKIFYSFYDLIIWTDGQESSSAEVKIQHYDVKECGLMAEFLKEKIQSFDKNSKVFIGTPYVAADESIADVQLWYKNRMNAIEGQLEHARAGYIIETSWLTAIITGALTGGFAAGTVLLFEFVFRRHDE